MTTLVRDGSPMIAATMFSGIGAPETARPDWRWLWCAEIEPFPSAVLAARHPHSVNLGDVTSHDFADKALAVGRPEVLVFGSPCQSFSVAGRRLGLGDARGNLALVALAVVRRVRPRWFVFENVPGLLSSEGGRDFGAFLGAVAECGYLGCWRVLDAEYFGVPQRRNRVFFVGHLGDWRPAAEVLLEPESLCGHPPPSREAGQGASASLGASLDRGGTGQDAARGNLIATTLRARDASKGVDSDCTDTLVPVAYQCQGSNVGEAGTLRGGNGHLTGGVPFVTTAIPILESGKRTGASSTSTKAGDGFGQAGDPMFTLGADSRHAVAFHENQRAEITLNDTAGTPKVGGGKPGQGYPAMMQGASVRRLLPSECEKLMGFEPSYTAITYRGKEAADGPRYKACGNSMAVPCIRWILDRIEIVHRRMRQEARHAA